MSQTQEAVQIVDCTTGEPVVAVLHTELGEAEIIEVETLWSPERLRGLRDLRQKGVAANKLPQHVHWNWALKAVRTSALLAYRSFGIEAAGKMQGLMMVCLTGYNAILDPDKGKPLVYVEFVETAPWNSKEFTTAPVHKGIGVRLMQAAARASASEGFTGRVGLHSLPQSIPFYTKACEMVALGQDANHPGLEYFELTAAKAVELLKK